MAGTSNPSSAASEDRSAVVVPPLRSDLEVTCRQAAGQAEVVLKDPLGNRYFRVRDHEWFVARLFDGKRTVDEVSARAAKEFPQLEMSADEIRRFAQRLALAGVLRLDGRRDLARLLAQRKRTVLTRALAVPGRLFFFRVPLGNPDPLVSWLTPRLRPLIQPRTLVAVATLFLAALALALWQRHRLLEPRAEFLSPVGILWLLAAVIVIKMFHELGHAVTCRHFGGRVTEMGLCFIVFTPCLYCDVSDAWMFPERWRRMAVTAAGVAVELALAAVATIVFFLTRPGWLHQAAFSVMVAASLSTILFNGNPLLRYDGYYLLSDGLEMPNLRIRSRRYAAALMRRIFFGTPVADIDRPERRRGLVLAYAAASYLYGWFILYVILGLIYRKLEPFGLQALAALLIVMSVAVQIGVPLYQLAASLAALARGPKGLTRFVRPVATVAILAVTIGLVLAVSFNETLTRACVVEPLDPLDIRAPSSAVVVRVCARAGEHVGAGRLLVVLESPELARERDRADADCRENAVLLARARAAGDQTVVRQLELRGEQLETRRADAHARVDELAIAAPRDAVILTERPTDLVGRIAAEGDLLLRLARPGEIKVAMEMSERDAERVAVGSVADLRVRALPEETFSGRVAASSRVASTETAAVLTTHFGGEVPTLRTPAGWRAAHKLYRAEMDVFDAHSRLRPGMSGRARIHLGRTSVGSWLWTAVTSQLSLDVLLAWR